LGPLRVFCRVASAPCVASSRTHYHRASLCRFALRLVRPLAPAASAGVITSVSLVGRPRGRVCRRRNGGHRGCRSPASALHCHPAAIRFATRLLQDPCTRLVIFRRSARRGACRLPASRATVMPTDLPYDPARHEPLRPIAWDESEVLTAIEYLVVGTES